MTTPIYKKLIEVALPLPEINDASAYDKMPGIGPHPKGIHHWWARLPLPTARAVLFASVVDDPSAHPDKFPTEAAQEQERERLFGILRRMMQKKLHEHPEVYAEAQAEMLKSCDGKLPPVLDPFAGGGSIPLEANRLGFEAHAGDLNPVAVLLNKCNLEIAPRWAGQPPVNPESRAADLDSRKDAKSQSKKGKNLGDLASLRDTLWTGTHGLAEDVRYYGRKIREQAQAKIGHLYPKVKLPNSHGGGDANVIAWLWARTVASPNPAAKDAHVPLISTYWLSSKQGTLAWLKPVVNKAAGTYRFEVMTGEPPDRHAVKAGTKLGKGTNFACLLTGQPITADYLRSQGQAGKFGRRLLALVVAIKRGRIYVPATPEQEVVAGSATPSWFPDTLLSTHPQYMGVPRYGMTRHGDLFTPRQLTALGVFSDLVKANHAQIVKDARAIGLPLKDATFYADSITTFLALILDRCADFNNSLNRWKPSGQQLMQLFGRQAIPMVWDFAEANIMGEIAVCWYTAVDICADALATVAATGNLPGNAAQVDAADGRMVKADVLVSTDPPYYDNVPYSDLADFFYVWMRRTVGQLYPELFSTMLAPKMPELVASSERFDGDRDAAREHFESGFRKAFTALRERLDPRFPLTVYYAFKQEDTEEDGDDEAGNGESAVDLTTGWETLLDALISSGFQIAGTWPVRASQAWRMRAMGANALASYIVLACRPRSADAKQVGRREFLAELKKELPVALRLLQQGNVAPVDFAQAAIGPGMAIFTRYGKVIEANGQPMTVRTALSLINQTLDEVLAEQEGEFDADTRWAVAWFDQHAHAEGEFGDAETLSKAKNVGMNGLVEAGILNARAGKVRLLRREELDADWDPATDERLTVWEMTQYLIRALKERGESGAGELLRKIGAKGEVARDLTYRLFQICERRKWAQEAIDYNSLVIAWPEITKLARSTPAAKGPQQQEFQQ
jgi:putative DNA methylase